MTDRKWPHCQRDNKTGQSSTLTQFWRFRSPPGRTNQKKCTSRPYNPAQYIARWNRQINYPDFVENLDAKGALKKYNPEVVICSWSPPANNFEKHIFSNESVKTYIFIGSRYEYGSGDWETFKKQKEFDYVIDEKLSNAVIPGDGGNRRKH